MIMSYREARAKRGMAKAQHRRVYVALSVMQHACGPWRQRRYKFFGEAAKLSRVMAYISNNQSAQRK